MQKSLTRSNGLVIVSFKEPYSSSDEYSEEESCLSDIIENDSLKEREMLEQENNDVLIIMRRE